MLLSFILNPLHNVELLKIQKNYKLFYKKPMILTLVLLPFLLTLLFLSFVWIYFQCGIKFWIYKIEVMFFPKENCETFD